MGAITKAKLAERVHERVGLTKKESAEFVDDLFYVMRKALADGDKVKISGFGNFVVAAKHARKGRNPQTGEEIVIAGRRVLTFKASQVLKKTMNNGAAGD